MSESQQPLEGNALDVRDGTLFVYGEPIQSHKILREIGRGASGVVYLARNRTLDREEALKVWIQLRCNDQRDKQIQGIAEAQKLARANGKHAVQIFDARKLDRAVIATMEYMPSGTLKESVSKCTSVQQILGLGYAYLNLIENTTTPETLHGDPHWQNVLIEEEKANNYETRYWLKLCDFGTSAFNPNRNSEIRHWKSVWLTLVNITKRLPGSSDARTMVKQLREESINSYKNLAASTGVFTAKDKARALTAFMRDYMDFWDVDFRSDKPTPLEGASNQQQE